MVFSRIKTASTRTEIEMTCYGRPHVPVKR